MQKYVDGFVLPIATANLAKYREIASAAGAIWKEHGALEYYECVGDDLEDDDAISFLQIAGASKEETVIFSWIVYQSKDHRDRVNAAVMADPRMEKLMQPGFQPFDYKRMAYGGFKSLVVL